MHPPTAEEAPLPLAIRNRDVFTPQVISALDDPGGELMNYRNEPIPLRIAKRDCKTGRVRQRRGEKGEMHNVFSSRVHGDPATPVLSAHEGDPIRLRLLQGAQEEQHVFTIHGQRWYTESSDPDSGYSNGQPIGISEHFELGLTPPTTARSGLGAGDYLYYSSPTEDLWEGIWGILRLRKRGEAGLLPLPETREHARRRRQSVPVCPPDAPERKYVVHAITAKGNLPGDRLVYNEEFDLYDPDAILFVRAEDLADVQSGRRKPEPLILRAAAGDCIKVTLVNDLPFELPKTPHWNYNTSIVEGFNTNQVRPSNHVSLHPQLVTYDVRTDDGANVGYNEEQTVPPGESREYTWYAGEITTTDDPWGVPKAKPVEFGAINLRDMADVVNHGMHGAIGALIIEPQGATWRTDPDTHAQADVTFTDVYGYTRSFREFVVVYQSEIGMHSDDPRFQCVDRGLNCGTAIRNHTEEDGTEDAGHKAFNYRTEPFWGRLGIPPELATMELNERDLSDIFSSEVHGDPATPIFKAGVSQKVRVRIVHPSGHRRQHAFGLWGATWPHNAFAEGERSRRIGPNREVLNIGIQNAIGPMTHHNLVPFSPAGGRFAVPGDRLYLDQPSFKLSDGLWGIFRVTR